MSEDPAAIFKVMEPLREPIINAVIDTLAFQQGSRGLDVACGIGLEATRLAQAVAPSGSVVGIDLSMPLLLGARNQVKMDLPSGTVNFLAGNWSELPYEEASFDWVWSCDGVGYAPFDQSQAINEMFRVIKPGGRAVLLFWSSQVLLPGYPRLESLLNSTKAGLAPFENEMSPELHGLRCLSHLQAAGLERIHVETFVHTVYAPLKADIYAALSALLTMRWDGSESELEEGDRSTYQRICQDDSPEFILNQPNYCAFFTYTVFSGFKP